MKRLTKSRYAQFPLLYDKRGHNFQDNLTCHVFNTKTMKRILSFILLIFIVLTINSCLHKKIGEWDDNIKLSTKAVEFDALSDSVTVKTGGSAWRISDVSVNSVYFYDFKSINFESDSYIIKQDCFVVERRDKNTLFIKVAENPLNVQRIITVGLEAGDYFDRVTITQKPRP